MDKLSEITVDNTVSVKIDCTLNQEILSNNFAIIMQALTDLKAEQNKHSQNFKIFDMMKQMYEKLSNDKFKDGNRESQNEKDGNYASKQNQSLNEYEKQIQALKETVKVNQEKLDRNSQNLDKFMKDLKEIKAQIQKLTHKNDSLQKLKLENTLNKNSFDLKKEEELEKNNINEINKANTDISNLLKDLQNQIKSNEKRISILENLNENQSNNFNKDNDHDQDHDSKKSFDSSAILQKIQNLKNQVEKVKNKSNQNASQIEFLKESNSQLNQSQKQNTQDIQELRSQIKALNQQLKKIKNQDLSGISNMMLQIEKVKEYLNKLQNSNLQIQRQKGHSASGKNSFRMRSDSNQSSRNDLLNGKINQLGSRVNILENTLNRQNNESYDDNNNNPQKLPMIKRAKKQTANLNSTGYNQKSYKKDLNDLKHDMEIWIKSYFMNQQKPTNNKQQDSQWQYKVQEIKNILNKKADHEGMKKGLNFLQNKISQIYMYLTQPDSQDAMIVRKGFNCLSCSKKVQMLRGNLGPRMNWDNLQSTKYSPPKNVGGANGFPKYGNGGNNEQDGN